MLKMQRKMLHTITSCTTTEPASRCDGEKFLSEPRFFYIDNISICYVNDACILEIHRDKTKDVNQLPTGIGWFLYNPRGMRESRSQ